MLPTIGSVSSIGMHAGAEIAVPAQVASTKAYTSQIVSLVMIAVLLAEDSHAKAARRAEIIKSLLALPDAVRAALAAKDTVRRVCAMYWASFLPANRYCSSGQVRALAGDLKDKTSMLVFGRGWNYATALEAALKARPGTYTAAEALQPR